MPLTSYSPGEILTASSLNDNFTFAAANPPGGLTLISTTTIGTTVSSVTVSGAFSATYDNYLIVVNGGLASTSLILQLTLGASNTGYYWGYAGASYAGALINSGGANQTYFLAGGGRADGLNMITNVLNPFLADQSVIYSEIANIDTSGSTLRIGGFLNDTTSHTAFTLTTSTGTITGGTIRVYGYANS